MSDFSFDNLGSRPFDAQRSKTPIELGRVKLEKPIRVNVPVLAKERFTHGSYLKTADSKSEYILDENGRTILLFEGDGSGDFSSVYSPLSKELLRREILCLPEEQQRDLEQRLGLPQPKPEDVAEFRRIQASREADRTLLNQVMLLKQGFNPKDRTPIDQRTARGVIQKEYAITSAKSEIPIIGTFGLGPCIAVVAYDLKTATAALAHVDGTTNVESLEMMFTDMGIEQSDLKRLRVGLIGGDRSSRKKAIEIIRYLQDRGFDIAYADILDKPHPSGFVIDSRNGKIIPNVVTHNNGEDEDLRMQIAGLQMNARIKKEFDGRSPK